MRHILFFSKQKYINIFHVALKKNENKPNLATPYNNRKKILKLNTAHKFS